SRTPGEGMLGYAQIRGMLQRYELIVNATPLGTWPKLDEAPPLPYDEINDKHLLFDLVYNPAKSLFLAEGAARGARISNGYDMLVRQAEAAWSIWNQDTAMSTKEKVVDFSNTEIAFSSKSDSELLRTDRLFKMMNNPTMVRIGSRLGLFAVRLGIPFVDKIIKDTIFEQFCGGVTLLDSQRTIDKLYR